MKTIVFESQKTILLRIPLIAILIFNTKMLAQQETIKTTRIANKLTRLYKEVIANDYQVRETEINNLKRLLNTNTVRFSKKETILMSIVLSIGLGSLIVVYLRKRKKLRAIRHKNRNQELSSYNEHIKAEQLSATLIAQEEKIKKLAEYNNELFEVIEKSAPQDVEKIKQDIDQLLSDLKIDSIIPHKTEKPQETKHSRLLYVLKQKHPSLSKTDLKHCLFIYMQLSLKETAALLHVTIATVKSGRHRAKNKINLNPNSKLREYLDQI
ncbi:hypothetical protein AWE51_14365 [Aquimarina aggregata]|uniref:HTH luxR-type domain-containing protein n=1 Tax=Aquimarina aggregata TaxID=1642818 RepID=A0A162XTJ9_9FLAO|nr:hypothetical protein [Aquimarina aggregata]KZS38767.1 hypothetical protein AWE51_14365 [Aquimarina aggregata]